MKTVVGLFDSYEDAEHALRELTDSGFKRSSITIATSDQAVKSHLESKLGSEPNPIVKGFAYGVVFGALLVAITLIVIVLGMITVPAMLNPFATPDNPLSTAAIELGLGALLGAIIGMLIGSRFPKRKTTLYAEGIRPGMVLIAVTARNDRAVQALSMMRQTPPEPEPGPAKKPEWHRSLGTGTGVEVTTTGSDDNYPKLSG
jgi:hypothetical protein